MVEIIWTRSALNDLRAIFNYISEDSIFYATRFTNQLLQRVNVLKDFPLAGRIVPEKEDPAIRELIEGNYRIFYLVKSQKKILILRIHHSAKNIR